MSGSTQTDAAALESFSEKFNIRMLEFHRDAHWVLSLRPEQVTLGSVVVSSAAGALSFESCSTQTLNALGQNFARLERFIKDQFGAVRLNILCLMMVDPIVHFHVIPRYDTSKDFSGQVWSDSDWPAPVVLRPSATSPEVIRELHDRFAQGFGSI